MKQSTMLFLLVLEHCVENIYFKLWQDIRIVYEKIEIEICNSLQRNNINNNKCDAIKMLHEICEKDSLIDCELLAYSLNNII